VAYLTWVPTGNAWARGGGTLGAVLLAGDANMRADEVGGERGLAFGGFTFPIRHCPYEGDSWDSQVNRYARTLSVLREVNPRQ
jgi:hypothetical protein